MVIDLKLTAVPVVAEFHSLTMQTVFLLLTTVSVLDTLQHLDAMSCGHIIEQQHDVITLV